MRPVKVLLISPSLGSYGGLEAFAFALADDLQSASDLEMRVAFKKVEPFQEGEDLRAAVRKCPARVDFVPKGSLQLWAAIRWADVVHLLNLSPDVALCAFVLRKPLMVTVAYHRKRGHSPHLWAWRCVLWTARRKFFISRFVRSTWDPDGRLPATHVVHPISQLPRGRTPVEERRGFAFIGRWIANKGVDLLVRAYEQAGLDPVLWPLELMGSGPLLAEIQDYVRAHNVKGVVIRGFVDEETKAAVIRNARFMVIPPNTREDFGLTAIEARNLGVPCIITRDGGLPEAAGQFVISAEPGNVDDLCRALREAAALSLELYREMAEKTYDALQGELVLPAAYISHYLELAGRIHQASPGVEIPTSRNAV